MPLFKRICFIPLAAFFVFALAAYGIGGIIINSYTLDQTSFRGYWPLNHKPGIVLLMSCQVGLIIAAIPGIIGIIRGSINILFVPGFVYLGILSTLTILGTVALRDSSKDMTHEIMEYLGKDHDLHWLSGIQWENECCGVKSYMDYQQLNFEELEKQSVPFSCCKRNERVPSTDCGYGALEPSKNFTEIEETIIPKGCNAYISHEQSKVLFSLGIEMISLGVIAGLVTGFLYWGIISLGNQEENERNQIDDAENPEFEDGGGDTNNSAQSSKSSLRRGRATRKSKRRNQRTRSLGNDMQNNNQFQAFLQAEDDYEPKIIRPRKRLKNASILKSTLRNGRLNKKYATLPPSFRKSVVKRNIPNVEMLYKKNSIYDSTTPCTSNSPQDFMEKFRELQEKEGSGRIESATALFPQTKIQLGEKSRFGTGYYYSSSVPSFRSANSKRVEFLDPKSKALAKLSQLVPPKPQLMNKENCVSSLLETEVLNTTTPCSLSISAVPYAPSQTFNTPTSNIESILIDDEANIQIDVEPIILEQVRSENLVQESGELILQNLISETNMDGNDAAGGIMVEFMEETNENKVEIETIEPIENEVYMQM